MTYRNDTSRDGGKSSRSSLSYRNASSSSQERSSRSESALQSFVSDANSNRIPFIVGCFLLVAAILVLRLFWVQVLSAPGRAEEAESIRTASFPVEARRGTIYDRNGIVLATSVKSTTIYANPSEVENPSSTADALAEILGGKSEEYLAALTADKTNYSVIERKADVELGDAVKDLGIAGIYFTTEYRREYPNGQVGGQVIGACSLDVDEESGLEYYYGVSGLEQYYDEVLSGEPGYYEAERGSDGTPIPGAVHKSKAAIDGEDIIISIDIELQRYVEDRLSKDKKGLMANGGSSIVMDGGTGEIYAAASLPLFNPADRSEIEEGATQLKCVTDLFEPGSIFKSVSTMAILESGTMNPDDQLFCPAYIYADGYSISDAHERGDATFTLRQILDQSSNVGISLATENMGFEELCNKIIKYNLNSKTGVDYPGEGEEGIDTLGYLLPFDEWSKVTGYNVSFGQGISLTPLQITRFYGAIVNDGVECTPHFLVSKPQSGKTIKYDTEKVIEDKKALANMKSMLKTVVSEGTGQQAAIEGFKVAGKTSTAEIYDEKNGGYKQGVYNLAFTGFIADSSSQLVCFVGANEVPTDGVVTPVFKDIMSTAIDRFNIHPE